MLIVGGKRNYFFLLIPLLLVIILPFIIYNSNRKTNIVSKAALEQKGGLWGKSKGEEYSDEIIFKFRQSSLKNLNGKNASTLSIEELKNSPELSKISDTLSVYAVASVSKVIPDILSPDEDLKSYKQKFPDRPTLPLNQYVPVDLSQTYKIKITDKNNIPQIIQKLLKTGVVEYAVPNYMRRINKTGPNDPFFQDTYPDGTRKRDPKWTPKYNYQWNLDKIKFPQAWNMIKQIQSKVVVAVIDTGIDYTHPELGGCSLSLLQQDKCILVTPGKNFVYQEKPDDPLDDFGHGTHVAGIIASISNNNTGIASVSHPKIRIMPLKTFDREGGGAYDDILANAIYFAVQNGAKVINASWGGPGKSIFLEEAFAYARQHGVVSVVAAGNDDDDASNYYPAGTDCSSELNPDVDCTITVSATDQFDKKSSYSNWGTSIDVAAPGGDDFYNLLSLKSTLLISYFKEFIVSKKYLRASGTSMSAPHVAGLAALIIGKNPQLLPDQTRNIILNGSDDLGYKSYDDYFGYGRINIAKTLKEMNISPVPIAKISFPVPNLLVGKYIKVIGSAMAKNFINFTLDYSSDRKIWINQGVTLENSGTSEIKNAQLGSIDLAALKNGKLFIRLIVNSSDTSVQTIIPIMLDSSIDKNFPVSYDAQILVQEGVYSDIDYDGKKEILFKDSARSQLAVLNHEGKPLDGWPQSTGEFYSDYLLGEMPLVGDVDRNTPGKEVFLPVSEQGWGNQILGFYANGVQIPGWTIKDWGKRGNLGYDNSFGYSQMSSSRVSGKTVILYPESMRWLTDRPLQLQIFDQQTENIQGWPIIFNKEDFGIVGTPIVSDLDNDENEEIVFIYYPNQIYVYSREGMLVRSIQLSPDDQLWDLRVVDIDADLLPEIIGVSSVCLNHNLSKCKDKIYVWDKDGNIKTGAWPYEPKFKYSALEISIGDFNNDKKPEILVNQENLRNIDQSEFILLNSFGKVMPGFPISAPKFSSLGANVSLKDGRHIWAFSSEYRKINIFVYDSKTSKVQQFSGFPKVITNSYNRSMGFISLLDLDKDGKLELLFPFWIEYTHGYLYRINLNVEASVFDWPQFLHDESHTNVYNSSVPE